MEFEASRSGVTPIAPPSPGSTAVPTYLPLGFIAAGLVSFLLLTIELVWALPTAQVYVRHNAHLLVLVHLFTLTWGSGVTLGVLHQMAPVIVSAKLYSVPLGWFSLALFVPGSLLLALSFRTFWLFGVATGGTIVIAGAIIFVYNIVRTLISATQRDVTHRYIVASLAAFVGTLLAGLTMALILKLGAGAHAVDGLLITHLLLGAGGWFTGIIVGVTYRLVSMFLLVHAHSERRPAWIFSLLYGGIALAVLGAPWGGVYVLPGLLLSCAGITLYALDFAALWNARGRRPDIWMRQVAWAVCYVVASAYGVLAVAIWGSGANVVPPRIVLALGLLFALGWVSTMILSLLHKIVPFLVWFHRYSGTVGRVSVPAMSDLTNERLGRIAFPVYHGSLLLTIFAVVLGVPSVALITAGVFALTCAVLMYDLVLLLLPAHPIGKVSKSSP